MISVHLLDVKIIMPVLANIHIDSTIQINVISLSFDFSIFYTCTLNTPIFKIL